MGRTVLVGRVRRAHGIRGEVMVDRYGDAPGILDPGSELMLRRQSATFTMTVEKVRATPKGWIVAFKDLNDRNEAEALAGAELSVELGQAAAAGRGDLLPVRPHRPRGDHDRKTFAWGRWRRSGSPVLMTSWWFAGNEGRS